MIKPMIMSSPSVKALLDGRKTMTRRVMKPQPKFCQMLRDGRLLECSPDGGFDQGLSYVKPPYAVGDIVYIKETFTTAPFPCAHLSNGDFRVIYKADTNDLFQWTSALFMPKKFARLWYPITKAGAGRVQEIQLRDIRKEGWPPEQELFPSVNEEGKALKWFGNLWDSLNAKRGYPWADNPWVWIYEFGERMVSDG